ncbi:P-type conjugative transfer protein TrbG [Bilophila wadsworthia]|uniref:P-type conjugative transfer protein TrbG n=1 Tax=Bilophila wadsworthia TaxID=35833 RepID=UPI00241DA156|nr:P-type conjugative transfer protein TrbG [Bilophila wadsworthia]
MNRLAVIVTLVAPFVIPLSVLAAQSAKTGGELPDLPLEALYFGGENPALTPSEERALRIAREWQAKAATQLTPVPGPDGAIQFLYGAVQPSIVCAVMQVTDIELQPGEQINNINIGDSARWLVEPAVTGAGVAEVQHIVIKPMDVGLETSLMVTTNRRTYHFRLKSHKTQYMPKISFIYPDAVEQRFLALKERQKEEKEKNTIPETQEYLGNLDFDYRISGSAPWKPVRVYNDGTKTIIQMPPKMRQTEAPSLLVMNNDGEALVNYRLQGDRFIVDQLFEKAMLIAGVGSKQTKITITKGK